jgi:hypothetical protein
VCFQKSKAAHRAADEHDDKVGRHVRPPRIIEREFNECETNHSSPSKQSQHFLINLRRELVLRLLQHPPEGFRCTKIVR